MTDTTPAAAHVEEPDGALLTSAVTALVVAVVQPELLPGVAIGIAAAMGPKLLTMLGPAVRPVMKTAVRAGYATTKKARELAAEANEQIQDLVAEAKAEEQGGSDGPRLVVPPGTGE